MYPLNMKLENGVGFAVANNEAEHKELTGNGYGPAYASNEHTIESVRAELDAAGIEYDKRLGLAKLIELLPS